MSQSARFYISEHLRCEFDFEALHSLRQLFVYRSNGLGVFIPDVLNKLSNSKSDSRICDVLQVKSLQANETISGPIVSISFRSRVHFSSLQFVGLH